MQVDFSKLTRDRFSCIESPTLILMNKSGLMLGPLAFYHSLKMELKYNELSEVTFELPAWVDGNATPLYNDVVGEKLIRIDPFGIFVISNPTVSGDGLQEIKSCTAYSLEYELAGKQVTFGAGTYPLYDPLGQQDTVLSMVLERTRHWKVGSVPASLYGKYRTFDQTDITALDFLLTDVQKSFGCVFVFDTSSRTIHVVDANDKTAVLPIYMSFDNLLLQVDVSEVDNNMATRVAVSGADGVSIRNVNPTGTNEIIHLGYAISQGDISEATAQRYLDWQNSIQSRQAYYTSLVAMRNSTYARYLTEKARLTDLEGELTSLDNIRSVLIQGRAMATKEGPADEEGTIQYFDARLEEVAVQHQEKQVAIDGQKDLLEDIDAEYDQYGADIKAINDELRYESYFTTQELEELDHHLVDGSFEDSTFATFDVDVSASGDSFVKPTKATLSFTDVSVTDIQMTNTWECGNHHSFSWTGTPDVCPQCGNSDLRMTSGVQRRILALSNGSLSIDAKDYTLSAKLISGTMDYTANEALIFSAYLGSGVANGSEFPSGNLSCVCNAVLDIDQLLSKMNFVVDEVLPSNHIHIGDDHLDPFFAVWNSPSIKTKQEAIAKSALNVHNAGRTMQANYGLGNVDLTQRPQIESSVMQAAGWDAEAGGYATVFSSTYDIPNSEGKMCILHVTPILPDGRVLSPQVLEGYLYETLDRTDMMGKDTYGIILRIDSDVETDGNGHVPDHVWEESDAWDIALHNSQEAYFEIYNAFVNEIKRNGFYQALESAGVTADTSARNLVPYITVIGLLCRPTYQGDMTFTTTGNGLYFTRNVTEYQQYSVEQELYDYAMERIDELAYPTFEFEVKSGNILWSEELEPLKNNLALGKGVYLQLNEETLLKPLILEIHLDFEQPENFSIIFSSEFQVKRPDKVNELRAILDKAQSTSRTLDLSKYEFGKLNTSGAYSALQRFFRDGTNAAYQQLLAGANQEVIIDGSGLSIKSPGSSEYIKLNSGMIALIDDEAKTARMAMGHFYNTSTQQNYYGVLADVIGGTLIAGKNLHMECLSPSGEVTQFKFDGTGAFLNNSRMYLQSDKGGRIGLDPNTGFIAGTSSLFTVTDTGVIHPSCLDDAGKLILDKDGFPQDTNVYIGIDGKAYFRGNIYANDGVFNGMLYAKGGEFTGTLKATTLDGKLVGGANGGMLEGIGLNVGDGKFVVDQSGNLTLAGSINLSSGSITWGKNAPTKKQFSVSVSGPWHDEMQTADKWRRDWDYFTDMWDVPYQFRGTDGRPGSNGSDASVTRDNMVLAMLKSKPDDGLYTMIGDDGKQYLGINASAIKAGVLVGRDIYGGKFCDYADGGSNPNVWLDMGMVGAGYGLNMWHKSYPRTPIFSIWDNATGMTRLNLKGDEFLYHDPSSVTKPQGKWDFGDADVKGVTATFA